MNTLFASAGSKARAESDLAHDRRSVLRGAAMGAAALAGFGLIFWIAANWGHFGRFGQFGVVGAVIAGSSLLAVLWGPARAPSSLVALLATGALLAVVGQTYQTGADPWQLFAFWAALTLPLALAARHEAVWIPWILVVFTALPLWVFAQGGTLWNPAVAVVGPAWAVAVVTAAVFAPGAFSARLLGPTHWSQRVAVFLTLGFILSAALPAILTDEQLTVYAIGLALCATAIAVFLALRPLDFVLLSFSALAADILVIVGIGRAVSSNIEDAIGLFLIWGLLIAAVISITAVLLLKIARRYGVLGPTGGVAIGTWPVTVLTGIGALLAAFCFLGFLWMMLEDYLLAGSLSYGIGVGLTAVAVIFLRMAPSRGFVQQFNVILLLVGLAFLGLSLFRDGTFTSANAVMMLVTMTVAAAIPHGWIRGLLGVASAANAMIALANHLGGQSFDVLPVAGGIAAMLGAVAGAGALLLLPVLRSESGPGKLASAVTPFAVGWTVAGVIALIMAAGQTFLLESWIGGVDALPPSGEPGTGLPALILTRTGQLISITAAVAGLGLMWRRYVAVRGVVGASIAAAVTAIAALVTGLGAAVFVLAAALAKGRGALGVFAAVAFLWIVGSFYYWLGWSLVEKAYLLIGLGLALGAIVVTSSRGTLMPAPAGRAAPARSALAATLIGLSVTATAAVVGPGVWEKEALLRSGRTVFVALAPVDPRSIMQGDYMALRFALPPDGSQAEAFWTARSMTGIAEVDARGVATVVALVEKRPETLPANQVAMTLTWKGGTWIVGTDAWFFKEGTGAKYEPARFGVFRVGADGQVMLEALADESLAVLR